MSNLHLFLSLAGFTTALFAWFRFDINKRFDDMKASTNQRFDDMNKRFDDLKEAVNDLRLDMREDMRQIRNWLFRLHGLVPLHSDFDRLAWVGYRKTGRSSGATSTSRPRGCPGVRRRSPRRSRLSSIW